MQAKKVMWMWSACLANSVRTWHCQRMWNDTYVHRKRRKSRGCGPHIWQVRCGRNIATESGRHILCISIHQLNMCKRDCTELKNPTAARHEHCRLEDVHADESIASPSFWDYTCKDDCNLYRRWVLNISMPARNHGITPLKLRNSLPW